MVYAFTIFDWLESNLVGSVGVANVVNITIVCDPFVNRNVYTFTNCSGKLKCF